MKSRIIDTSKETVIDQVVEDTQPESHEELRETLDNLGYGFLWDFPEFELSYLENKHATEEYYVAEITIGGETRYYEC